MRQSRIGVTRRQFMGEWVAAVTLLSAADGRRHFGRPGSVPIDPQAIATFGKRLQGQIILPTDPTYEQARRVASWNPQTDRRPAVIVRCAHTDDVLRSIDFAHTHSLETAVRGGGHSYQGWGTCDGIVIDLSGMKAIEIDAAKRIGRVGGGALGGELTQAASAYGLAPSLGDFLAWALPGSHSEVAWVGFPGGTARRATTCVPSSWPVLTAESAR